MLKVSISGLLSRLKGRRDQLYVVGEFIKHYKIAKKAHTAGNAETVKQFFDLYVTEEE